MKYCNSCGASVKDRARKCPKCGVQFDTKAEYDVVDYDDFSTHQINPKKQKALTEKQQDFHVPTEKSKGAAMALSIFPPGLGLLYAGNWKKGLKILLVFLIVMTVDIVTKVAFEAYVIGIPISIIGYPSTIIWSIVSTNNHFKNYNERGTKTGKWSDSVAVNYDDFSTHQINPKKLKAPSEKLQDFSIPLGKSKGLAIALSIIPPGIGLMYLGKWRKGFVLLIAFLLVVTLDVFIKAVWELWSLIGITIVGYLTTIIWSIVSTNNQFKNYSTPSAKYAKT